MKKFRKVTNLIINGSTKLIAILFDGMRFRVCFDFTLTLTLSLKGEGDFLSLPLPSGRGLR